MSNARFSKKTFKSLKVQVKISEEDLISGVKASDRVAITALYDNYSAALYGIILRIVGTEVIAEDVLQDTFVKAWRSFSNYDPSKGKLFTWLAQTARYTAIDQIRSKYHRNTKNDESIEDNDACRNFMCNGAKSPELIGIKSLADTLKPEQRSIIDLIYFQGFTHLEVAEHLSIPLGTVKTRLRLGMLTLRKLFN